MIRELVANAIRHGHAEHIRIAGSLENGLMMISVRDDGCGFDPAAAPGVAEGHFGLQGIRERLARYGGELRVESAPGKGTRAVIRLDVASDETDWESEPI